MPDKQQPIPLPREAIQLIIPEKTLDHILVVTIDAEVISFQLRHLQSLQPHQISSLTVVHYLEDCSSGMLRQTITIQERPQEFWQRSMNLLAALLQHDEKGINRHFAPNKPALRPLKLQMS